MKVRYKGIEFEGEAKECVVLFNGITYIETRDRDDDI